MNEKKCANCLEIKTINKFPKDKQQATGIKPYCKICSNVKNQNWYKKNKKQRLKTIFVYNKRPEQLVKMRARFLVHANVQRGKIKKEVCIKCKHSTTYAHHHLGYAKKHRLDIQWLCMIHHMEAHHV